MMNSRRRLLFIPQQHAHAPTLCTHDVHKITYYIRYGKSINIRYIRYDTVENPSTTLLPSQIIFRPRKTNKNITQKLRYTLLPPQKAESFLIQNKNRRKKIDHTSHASIPHQSPKNVSQQNTAARDHLPFTQDLIKHKNPVCPPTRLSAHALEHNRGKCIQHHTRATSPITQKF